MVRRQKEPTKPVHSISTVPTSIADDQSARMRTYLISMGIRTLCFVAAAVAFVVTGWVWLTLMLSVAAVILPYPAVVLANNSGNRQSHFIVPATPTQQIGTTEDQERSPGAGEHW